MRLSHKNFRFFRWSAPASSDAPSEPQISAREQLARAARIRRASARAEALLAVAQRIGSLPPAERERFARTAGLELAGIVEKLSNSTTPTDRRAAAACIALRPHALLLPLLHTLIRDSDAAVRAEADAALLAFAHHAALAPLDPADREFRRAFDRSLADLAADFPKHRSKVVLEAVLLHATRPGPALRAFLADADQPAHLPLRAALRKSKEPHALPAALSLLSNPSLGPAAAETLLRLPSDPAPTLALWPLLAHPARQRRFKSLAIRSKSEQLLPTAAAVSSLPEQARLGAVRWARDSVRNESALVAFLADFLADESAPVRLAAVHALASSARHPAAADLLRDFSFDRDASVARAATIALAAPRTPTPAPWCAAQSRSPHVALRNAAPALSLACDDPLRSPLAARAALAQDHGAFIGFLRREIGQGTRRREAVAVVRRLGLARHTELELLAAAADPADHRLVATAALTLADADSPSALHAVSNLVGHADARVRANALEAVARLDPGSPLIEAKLIDPHPRTRANAILAALRDPPRRARAVEALLASLADDRAPLRLSALWAVEHAAPPEAANHVAALASEASSGPVRTRARRAARRLLASMREAPRLKLTA